VVHGQARGWRSLARGEKGVIPSGRGCAGAANEGRSGGY
jgi:hypothetical protein